MSSTTPEPPAADVAPPLTAAEAQVLIDALLGFRAALVAHDGVKLPSLTEFLR
jgi:hypothetical protein